MRSWGVSVSVIVIAVGIAACRSEKKADVNADVGREAARRAMSAAGVPGIAFASVTREREIGVGAVGLADTTRAIAAGADTVFEAASIAKVIVATCVMQLVEERKLDLDRDVAAYVGFPVRHPAGGSPITLRMLLTHRASIRDRQDEISAGAEGNPLGPFLKAYLAVGDAPRAAAFLDAGPGVTMQYSNVGAALAAFAVERVSGESFAATTVRRIFVPLRMNDTTWTKASPASPAWATPYILRDAGFVPVPHPFHAVYPAVDLLSSARDLARFARAILRDGELEGARILSAASVRAMVHGDDEQALAWQLRSIGGARVAGHEGEDTGASTAFFLDLAAGTGAVVLANGDAFGSGNDARAAAIQSLVADLLAAARTPR